MHGEIFDADEHDLSLLKAFGNCYSRVPRTLPCITGGSDGQRGQKVGLFCQIITNRRRLNNARQLCATARDDPHILLYGEPLREVGARFIHIEPLEDRSKQSDWNIRPHAHADLNHVFFINRGKGEMTADGVKIPFTAPCLLVLPAGRVHGFAYEPGAASWVRTIAEAYLRELIGREPSFSDVFSNARCLVVEDEEGMEDQLFRLGQELVWNAPGYAAAIESHLLGILVAMLRLSHHATREVRLVTGRAGELVARFRVCVELMYRTSSPLQDYAASLSITQAQLRRACV